MNFTSKEFIDFNMSPSSYMVLYSIINNDEELLTHLKLQFKNSFNFVLKILQEKGYLKLNSDNTWILRKKALDLQSKNEPEVDFDKFWDEYHKVTSLKKTDLQAAMKYWKKLTKKEKKLALDNIKPYYDSLPIYTTGKPVKKARTYLGDKNFNDEFEIKVEKKSLNKMI